MTLTTRQARTIRAGIEDARSQRLSSSYLLTAVRTDLQGRAFNRTAHRRRQQALMAAGVQESVQRAALPTWPDLTAANVEGYRARVAEEQAPFLVSNARMAVELAELTDVHLSPSQMYRLNFLEGAIRYHANKIDELDAQVDAYRERITR